MWVYRTTSQRKFWTTLQGGLKLQGWLKNQVAWSLQWEGFWETFWKEPRHPSVQPTLCRPAKPPRSGPPCLLPHAVSVCCVCLGTLPASPQVGV